MVKNASQMPKRFFGLHMLPGIAEYQSPEGSFRIFINEDTIKAMNPTFEGCPIYVRHKDEINLEKLQEESDGYVVRSFYNAADGKHWAEFLVVSDKGHDAIRAGWRLSNCYVPEEYTVGGLWNGVEYLKEVTKGKYHHLAIVPNPRYDESVIMTPEQFKEYNEKKTLALNKLSNSKGDTHVKFNFFKKEKVENAADLEQYNVVLPLSKKEMTVSEAIDVADKFFNMHGYANMDHMVKVGDEEMSVNDMCGAYSKMKSEMDELKKKNDTPAEDAVADAEVPMNAADEEKPKEDEKKENSVDHFETIANAHLKETVTKQTGKVNIDAVSRGKARYGSGK